MAEQPGAGAARRQGDAPEVVAVDTRHPVVRRDPLVEERVVRGEQVGHAAVFLDDAPEQKLRLGAEPLPQVVVEVGEGARVGRDGVEVPQVQPLRREVRGQGLGAGVGQHAPHLGPQHVGVAQAARRRHVDQLVVGQAAPQEERQARGQLEAADGIRGAGVHPRRIALDAEQELGARQQGPQGGLDAGLEPALGNPFPIEPGQLLDVAEGDGTPVGAPGQRGDDRGGARLGLLHGGVRGAAREDAVTARRPADARGIERPRDRDGAHRRLPPGVAVHVVVGVVGLPGRLEQGRVLLDEGGGYPVRARSDRQTHVQVVVDPLVRVVSGVGLNHHVRARLHGEEPQPLAVEGQLHLVRLGQPLDVLVAVALQADLNLVLAVEREDVVDDGPSAGAERQAVDVVLLGAVGGHDHHPAARGGRPAAHGQLGDGPGGGEIPLHQGRRQPPAVHVVEPEGGVVPRQQRGDVDLQRQQVADRVLILGPVQPPEGLGAAGIGMGPRRLVERGLEIGQEAPAGRGIGTRTRTRGHRARAQLPDDLLPDLRVRGDVSNVHAFQRQPARLEAVAVAGDAVPGEDGPLGGGRLDAGGRGRNRLRFRGSRRQGETCETDDGAPHEPTHQHPFHASRHPSLQCGLCDPAHSTP